VCVREQKREKEREHHLHFVCHDRWRDAVLLDFNLVFSTAVCVYVRACMCACVCLCMCVCVCVCVSRDRVFCIEMGGEMLFFLSYDLYVSWLIVRACLCLSVYLSVCPSVCLCVCFFVRLSDCLRVSEQESSVVCADVSRDAVDSE